MSPWPRNEADARPTHQVLIVHFINVIKSFWITYESPIQMGHKP